jgi:hypothetical protein
MSAVYHEIGYSSHLFKKDNGRDFFLGIRGLATDVNVWNIKLRFVMHATPQRVTFIGVEPNGNYRL